MIPLLTVFNAASLNPSRELTHTNTKNTSDLRQSGALKAPVDTVTANIRTDTLQATPAARKPINRLPAHYVCEIGLSDAPILSENADSIIHPASLVKPALAMTYFKLKNDSLFTGINRDTIDFIEARLQKALIRSHNKAADDVALFLVRTLYPEEYGKNSKESNIRLYADRIANPILRSDIGLKNTRITNANGLDGSTMRQEYKGKKNKLKNKQPLNTPEKRIWRDWAPTEDNYSSTRDLAKLYEHIYLNYPEIVEIMAKKSFQGQPNTNPFFKESFKDARVFSGKTGFTDESGYNMATFTKTDDGRTLIVLSLGNCDGAQRRKIVTQLMNKAGALPQDIACTDQPQRPPQAQAQTQAQTQAHLNP